MKPAFLEGNRKTPFISFVEKWNNGINGGIKSQGDDAGSMVWVTVLHGKRWKHNNSSSLVLENSLRIVIALAKNKTRANRTTRTRGVSLKQCRIKIYRLTEQRTEQKTRAEWCSINYWWWKRLNSNSKINNFAEE